MDLGLNLLQFVGELSLDQFVGGRRVFGVVGSDCQFAVGLQIAKRREVLIEREFEI